MPTSIDDTASDWLTGTLPTCPPVFNAARYCVGVSGARTATKDALIAVDASQRETRRWSFADVARAVRVAAGTLRAVGVGAGDRVVILLGDVPEFPFAYFGAIAAGGVATPLSSQLSKGEIQNILRDADPKVVLINDDVECDIGKAVSMNIETLLAGEPADFADTRADDAALLVYTSGSSGRPKGVLHAHRAFWARQSMHAGWHDIRADDRVMHAGAFNWTYTLGVGLTDTWSVGATAILNAGARTPETWPALAARHQPTVFAAAPAVFRRILKYGAHLEPAFASLRHAVTAGEKLSPAIAESWRAETGKALLEALGMSEVSTYISTPPGKSSIPDHAGWPQPGRRVAVLDETGEPVSRGVAGDLAVHKDDPGLMRGYWRNPDLTAAAFRGDWFVTGDVVTMRDDGAIAFAGRRDDQMNAQGYRVDPQEVEAALLRHPQITECAVTSLVIEDGLSIIAAWIVADEPPSAEAVLDEAARTLADYKMPRALFLAKALPSTANGKVMRRKLPDLKAKRL